MLHNYLILPSAFKSILCEKSIFTLSDHVFCVSRVNTTENPPMCQNVGKASNLTYKFHT